MTKKNIARVAHNINKAFCEATGDHSQPTWDEAPDWQKDSAIAGVEAHIDNPGMTPEMSHQSWMKQKEEDGWKYGPEKNPETKEHPAFLPYDQLPSQQKVKDYLFKAVVDSLKKK